MGFTKTEALLVSVFVAILFIGVAAMGKKEERLLSECIELNQNTKFECKAMAYEMAWGR